MKNTILFTTIFMMMTSFLLGQHQKELITPKGLCGELEYELKFPTKQDTNTLSSIGLGFSHVIKQFNFGYYQLGFSGDKKITKLFDVPINNENKELSFSPLFIKLKNRFCFNLYQNNKEKKAYYLYTSYNLGYGIKSFKEKKGEYYLNNGILSEYGLGIQITVKKAYLNAGVSYSNYSYNGKIISDDINLSDIELNLQTNALNLQLGLGYSFGL